jgi:lipoprotein-anchoring transpeptidase ErfK/SrfK
LSSFHANKIALSLLHGLPASAGAACAIVCGFSACAFLAATPASAEVRGFMHAANPPAAEVRPVMRMASRPAGEIKTGNRVANRQAVAPAAKLPFGNIPKGPLQIFVSINQQKLHLYSNGEKVTETLVATGVPQHPTPTGAFSVVQKQLLHHSNIYSGAPMPFMERITWSGVALHEGVNLGHPASHGCIRMSHDFAVRLYAVSKLGAEVFISNAELAPQEFADPHLFVHKDPTPPVPVLAAASVTLPSALAQDSRTVTDAAAVETVREAKPVADAAIAADPIRDDKPAADIVAPADIARADKPAFESTVAADTAHNKQAAAENTSAADSAHNTKVAAEASSMRVIGDQLLPTPAPSWPASAMAMPLRSATANPAAAPKPAPPIAAVTHMSKSPIAIFVSRKTSKIYVRQDFEPVFSAPITVEQPGQPLGTFVFTALDYLPDRSGFVWNVVSMPGERAKPKPVAKLPLRTRRDEIAVKDVDVPPPEGPAEALARIEIPQDTIDRISQMIVPGSSLILSDQGLGDETGEGTNFVVVMH